MRALFLAAVGLALAGGVTWSDDPKPVSDRAKQQVAAELVDKLGSHDFRVRDEAEKKLLEFGGVAFDVVKAGLSSETAEVAERCGRLLPKLRAARLRDPDSPAWKRFARVAGDTDGAKELFGTMAKEAVLGEWLERIEADPQEAVAAYQWVVNKLDGWWAERRGRIPTRAFPHSWLTFLVYVGGLEGAGKVTGPASKSLPADVEAAVQTALRTGVHSSLVSGYPTTATEVEQKKAAALAVRAMFGQWLAVQTAEPFLSAGISVAAETNLTEALPAVTWHAKDTSHPAALRVRCVGVAAVLGADAVPLAEPLLGETAEFARLPQPARRNAAPIVAQVRDVAAGLAVRSRGFQPADFGFENYPWPATAKPQKEAEMWGRGGLGGVRFGFADDAERERTHATVAAFLAIKPSPACPTYGKVVVSPPNSRELQAEIALIESNLRTAPDPVDARTLSFEFSKLSERHPGQYGRLRYERARMELEYPERLRNSPPFDEQQLFWGIDDVASRVDLRRRLVSMASKPTERQQAVHHLLAAYAELHPLELPTKRPEIPTATPPGAKATAKERAEFAVANTLRRDAQYVCDLMDARDGVVKYLRELFKTDPDELRKLAEKKLPKEAADALMKQIK